MESEKVQDNQVPQPQPTETAEKNSQEKDEINPLINVPPIENGNPETEKKEEPKKDRSKEVYTDGKGENDMQAVPKEIINPKKISEFEVINQDPTLKKYEWKIKQRKNYFKNQL